MNQRIHTSWLVGWFGLFIIIGIWVSSQISYFASAAWALTGLGLFMTALIGRKRYLIPLAVGGGLLLGLCRGSFGQESLAMYQPLFGQAVEVYGSVVEDTAFGSNGGQNFKIKNVAINGQKLPGEIWLSTASQADVKRSDRVILSGKLSHGFGNFPASIHQASLLSVERVKNADIARDVRDWFAGGVRNVIGEPEASLGLGYLVGLRTALPEDLNEKLRILGLTHIIVASGYNLTILVRFSRRIFAKISKYQSVLAGFMLTFSFILITGLSPSMTRAGLVTSLCLVAWYFGRAIHPLVLLPAAAATTALIKPFYVWGDLGWYLSFAAFGGVIILSPLLVDYFFGRKQPNSFLQILVETVSAQLVTMPIIALAFGQFAPLAIISNLLILPLVWVAMLATFVAGLAGLAFGAAAGWLAWPAKLVLEYMVWVVNELAKLPIAVAEVDFNLSHLVVFYVVLIVVCVYIYRRTRHDFSSDSIIE